MTLNVPYRFVDVDPKPADQIYRDFAAVEDYLNRPWTPYVPVLTALTVNPTLGTGPVQSGRWTRIGRTVTGQAAVFFGTAGAAAGTGEYRVSLPVPALLDSVHNVMIGSGYLYDSSANQLEQVVVVAAVAQPGYCVMFKNGTFVINNASPWVWSTQDQIVLSFTYEANSA